VERHAGPFCDQRPYNVSYDGDIKNYKNRWKKIAKKAAIANNGQPQAVLVKVDAASFENTLSLLQKLEFMQNLTEMRLSSRRNGSSNMTLDEMKYLGATPRYLRLLGNLLYSPPLTR
jgi:hypothetical protein